MSKRESGGAECTGGLDGYTVDFAVDGVHVLVELLFHGDEEFGHGLGAWERVKYIKIFIFYFKSLFK